MSEDYALIALAETTKSYVKNVSVSPRTKKLRQKTKEESKDEEKVAFLRRLSFSSLRSNFSKLGLRLGRANCFKGNPDCDEDEIPMMDVPRHKSFDIGVGFARRASMFLFTRRSVCVHPYHPFTPKQSVRKFYVLPDEKHLK